MVSALPSPQPLFRPANERFHSALEWLDSWHSFSFAGHHHPDWMGYGPLRVINDDTIGSSRGFGMHPHRDMEIITVMVEGELTHTDSMGHNAVLRAGEVQRLSAGTGIVHSEINQSPDPCRLLHPDRKDGALAIARPVRLWRAQVEAGDKLDWPIDLTGPGWLQVIDGQLTLNAAAATLPAQLRRGDGLGFPNDSIPGSGLEALEASDLLLFALA
jgi:quercetin 2,3-dioxygenase